MISVDKSGSDWTGTGRVEQLERHLALVGSQNPKADASGIHQQRRRNGGAVNKVMLSFGR